MSIKRFEEIEAWKSARELVQQVYNALDQKYISEEAFNKIYSQAELVSKLNSGFIKYLRGKLK
jgi:four helix bundle protein